MRLVLPIILAIVLLSGCGGEGGDAQHIYRIHKNDVTVVGKDVVFTSNGNTLTAKGQVEELNKITEDYLKIVRYSDGKLVVAGRAK